MCVFMLRWVIYGKKQNAPRKASICTGILLPEFIKTTYGGGIFSPTAPFWASLFPLKGFIWFPSPSGVEFLTMSLADLQGQEFLSLHSAPSNETYRRKESRHSILQTQRTTMLGCPSALPLLDPIITDHLRLDLPITDCPRGFSVKLVTVWSWDLGNQ